MLYGGAGSNTYWFGDDKSTDTIEETNDSYQDMVRFQTSWQPSDMTIALNGNDLQLTGNGTGIILKDWELGNGYQLNRFYFAQTEGVYKVEFSSSGTGQFSLIT